MGIRFYCPSGHRLHVKSFLAGKRGICPHCGEKVLIPIQSTRPSARQKNLLNFVAKQVERTAQAAPSAPDDQEALVDVEAFVSAREADGLRFADESSEQIPVVAKSSEADPTYSPPPPKNLPSFSSEKDLVPEMQWHVRFTDGNQQGPIRGDVLRQWIHDRVITSREWVWHEGWSDWHSAAEEFFMNGDSRMRFPEAAEIHPDSPVGDDDEESTISQVVLAPETDINLKLWYYLLFGGGGLLVFIAVLWILLR